jgi:serine/threonine protein kinase
MVKYYLQNIMIKGNFNTKKRYALKCVPKEIFLEKCNIKNLKEERKIMMKLQHPFITKLEGTFQDPNNVFFV